MIDPEIEKFVSEVLRNYANIPDEEMRKATAGMKRVRIKKYAFFIRQGDAESAFALVYSGIFRVFCLDVDGNEKTLSFRKAGQFLAGYTPFLKNTDIWYSIQALTDSEIVSSDFSVYRALETSHPCWNELIKNYVTNLFIEKERRERSLLLDDAKTRYLHFLDEFPLLLDQISQYHIASYLGITPVSLSRIKSGLN